MASLEPRQYTTFVGLPAVLPQPHRYEVLVGGNEPLQSFLHKRLAENLNSEAALGTVGDVAECVQWLRSTFLFVRSTRDPRRYLGLPPSAPQSLISKKIEELCVKAMNSLATAGLITMDEASCIESTDAGRLMSIYYLDVETMKNIMKIDGSETLERLLALICESHEMSDMHLRVDERRCLNALNRNNTTATIRFPMKGKISTRQMKLNCIIQAVLGCLPITDPSLNQEAMKVMRVADRICKCLVAYVTRPDLTSQKLQYFSAVVNSIILAKCVSAHLWENSAFVSKQLKGIGPTFSALLASAGKVNFMLLEESHPRDLERIMNKGPPTGNTLRKQISLLPKYYLYFTPLNESTIILQLLLQNVSYLSENLEHLTAGETHKIYIIVGDTDNYLLLLTSIKDKDLISFYGGSITYEIARKRNCEHKIIAHCISSNFVGVDAQCEFLFKNLETPPHATHTETPAKKVYQKQICITDVFKQRKRKNEKIDNVLQHTKRKCDYAVLQKYNELKEPFNETFAMINKNINSVKMSSNIYSQEIPSDSINKLTNNDNIKNNDENLFNANESLHDLSTDINVEYNEERIDDEQINRILNNIENEICNKTAHTSNISNSNSVIERSNYSPTLQRNVKKLDIDDNVINKILSDLQIHTDMRTKPWKAKNIKSNFKFIDSLDKNNELDDDEESNDITNRPTGFSSTIKSNIDKYLKTIQHGSVNSNKDINRIVTDRNISDLPSTVSVQECISPLLTGNSSTTNEIVSCENDKNHNHPKKHTQIVKEDHLFNLESSLKNKFTIALLDTAETKLDRKVFISNYPASENAVSEFGSILSTQLIHSGDCEKNTEAKEAISNTEKNVDEIRRCNNNSNNYLVFMKSQIDKSILIKNEKYIGSTTYDSIHLNRSDFSIPQVMEGLQKITFNLGNAICVTATSYTSLNIKSTFDNLVQVIRKLNVNVDITKTIATTKLVNFCTVTEGKEKNNEEHHINDSFLTPRNITCKPMNGVTVSRNNRNYKDIEPGTTRNLYHKDSQLITISKGELRQHFCDQKSIGHREGLSEQEKKHFKINKQQTSNPESINTIDCKKENANLHLNMITQANTSTSNGCQGNNIFAILQKYSTLLRHTTSDLRGSTSHTDIKKQAIKTPKKPYKIKDIHNCEIALPKTFVCKASSNFTNVPVNSNFTIIDSKTDEDDAIRADSWSSSQPAIDKEIDGNKDFQDGNNSLVWLPLADDPREIDFKMNDSLFDPKALLLCLENDNSEVIIPPPPQFSDNFIDNEIYSPEQMAINDEINYETSHCIHPSNGESELLYRDLNTQNSQSSCSDYAYIDFPMQTFSTVNEDFPARTIPLHGTVLSRRNKLNQFKFPKKRKMKM